MTVQEILKSCNYPLDTLVIDFETFADPANGYGLKKMSTVEYIKDDRFRILGVAIKVEDEPAIFYTVEEFMLKHWLYHFQRTTQLFATMQSLTLASWLLSTISARSTS